MLRFTVPGLPQGKGRPRLSTRGGFARAFTPQKTVAYEGLIALAGQEAMNGVPPLDGPVSIAVTAFFPIPQSWSKRKKAAAHWHTSKPDGDNILKAVGDGLNSIAWSDDSQVALATITKRYGNVPCLEVEVTRL